MKAPKQGILRLAQRLLSYGGKRSSYLEWTYLLAKWRDFSEAEKALEGVLKLQHQNIYVFI